MLKRIFKGIKESLKELSVLKIVAKNILYFIVATLYIVDVILDKFYDLIAIFFRSINKRLQKAIFYLIIAFAVIGGISLYKEDEVVKIEVPVVVEKVKAEEKTEPLPVQEATKTAAVKENKCMYDNVSCKIKTAAEKAGIDYKIAIAIAKHETGNYTSVVFKTKNNVGGMMCNSSLMSFKTLDDGINSFINNLKNNYFNLGLNTIEKIQKKYCPIGAANDPKGLNKYWLSGVSKFYNEL